MIFSRFSRLRVAFLAAFFFFALTVSMTHKRFSPNTALAKAKHQQKQGKGIHLKK